MEQRFAEFVTGACGDLITGAALAAAAPLAVRSTSGGVILAADGGLPPGGDWMDPAQGLREAAITTREGVCGHLVARAQDPQFAPLLEPLAGEIGQRFSLELEIHRMTDDLLQSYDQMNLFFQCARTLRPDESLEAGVQNVLAEGAELLCRRLLIYFLPGSAAAGSYEGPGFCPTAAQRWIMSRPGELLAMQADLAARLQAVGSGEVRHRGQIATPHGTVDFVLMPITVNREGRGFVGLLRDIEQPLFETGEVRLVEALAAELSNAATNDRLHQELRELLYNVVRTLVNAIEQKDHYTRGHSERVVQLSLKLATRLGLPATEIQHLSWAAILHDIGKISIDDQVLRKPGRLTDEEYRHLQSHAAAGERMLKPLHQLHAIIPGIRHHHERYDGTGYPDRLCGEGIPLPSRIIAVADTFDAIVSHRPYRQAASAQRALDEIEAGSGTQFDPRVVDVLLALVAEEGLPDSQEEDAIPALSGGGGLR